MRNIDKKILKSIFINGLRGELQAELKSLELETLAEVKNRALMLKERNREQKRGVAPIERRVGFSRVPTQNKGGYSRKAPWGTKEGNGLKVMENNGSEKGGGEKLKMALFQVEVKVRN